MTVDHHFLSHHITVYLYITLSPHIIYDREHVDSVTSFHITSNHIQSTSHLVELLVPDISTHCANKHTYAIYTAGPCIFGGVGHACFSRAPCPAGTSGFGKPPGRPGRRQVRSGIFTDHGWNNLIRVFKNSKITMVILISDRNFTIVFITKYMIHHW